MRVVVTGAGGFIGWHAVNALTRRGDVVEAWIRRPGAADWNAAVATATVEMTDPDAIFRALAAFSPDAIIHLAAQSLPGQSWDEPALTYQVNVIGTIHLLDAARRLKEPPRVMLAGSSAEYAEPADDRPIGEDARTEPNSPYGSSKLAADQFAQLYVRRYDLDVVRFRPFFLAGPRKVGDVCSDFARRIVAIERGREGPMPVGSLDMVRDLIDVRDGITGLLRILDAGRRGEVYNICGGRGVSIRDILEGYRRLAAVPFDVRHDPALIRPLDARVKIGDPTKLRALGWKPEYALGDTLRSILEYWRAPPA